MAQQAAERAYDAIRTSILDGDLEQGAWLREQDLAEVVGVSRTPVREALRRLKADGLVEFSPNRGAQVVSYDDDDLADIYGLRALLESHAAALAAERIDPTAIEHLRELAEAMEEAIRDGSAAARDRVAELNRDFHATILNAAGSARLSSVLATVVLMPLVHRTFHRYSREALERSFDHHRELIAALDARDPQWAGAVMRSHVYAARAVLLGGSR